MKLFQIDAFAKRRFEGNPAAVCIVEERLSEDFMQNLALENNLSETAYVTIHQEYCDIRWFTPAAEVPLCGHATLASAFVLFEEGYWPKERQIKFHSLSGELFVTWDQGELSLNFPSRSPESMGADQVEKMEALFEVQLDDVLEVPGEMIFIFKEEEGLQKFDPDQQKVALLAKNGLITSAQSQDFDFVSRYFAPNLGIKEDPVTGFMHTILTPYWSQKMGKKQLRARQISARGGDLGLELLDDRVMIAGSAVKVFETVISYP